MEQIGAFVMPVSACLIILFGLFRKVAVFDSFVLGAKEGFHSTIDILPTLIGLITSITMLKASGALDVFSSFAAPVAKAIGIPEQVLPLFLLRPISGSGSLAILNSIFDTYTPDSLIGRVASVLMGSTETTFYAIAVYYGAVGIKKTRHTIPAAVSADFAAFFLSVLTVQFFF